MNIKLIKSPCKRNIFLSKYDFIGIDPRLDTQNLIKHGSVKTCSEIKKF